MGRFVRGMIELRMLYASTCAHPLQVTRDNRRAITHGIAMRQLTGQDPTENFHVAVTMGTKARPGGNTVLINHPQRAERHVIGVLITSERKAVPGIEPPMLAMASFVGRTSCHHELFLQTKNALRWSIRSIADRPPAPGVAGGRHGGVTGRQGPRWHPASAY